MATVRELMAIADDQRHHELIDGQIVEKASPTWDHSEAQSSLLLQLKGPFQRRSGGGPGGWWIGCELGRRAVRRRRLTRADPQVVGSVTPRWPWYLPPRSRYDVSQGSSDSKNSIWATPSLA